MRSLGIMLLLAACDAPGTARIRFVLPADLPAQTLFVSVRVEERIDPAIAGPILRSEGPLELRPDVARIAFEDLSIPHGERRVVIAELREGPSPESQVVFYGFSE